MIWESIETPRDKQCGVTGPLCRPPVYSGPKRLRCDVSGCCGRHYDEWRRSLGRRAGVTALGIHVTHMSMLKSCDGEQAPRITERSHRPGSLHDRRGRAIAAIVGQWAYLASGPI